MQRVCRILSFVVALLLMYPHGLALASENPNAAIDALGGVEFPKDLKIRRGMPVVLQVGLTLSSTDPQASPVVVFDLMEGVGYFKEWDETSLKKAPAWKNFLGYLSYLTSWGRIKIKPGPHTPPAVLFYPLSSPGSPVHIRARLVEGGTQAVDFLFAVGADRGAEFKALREKRDQAQAALDKMNYQFEHSWTRVSHNHQGFETFYNHSSCRYTPDKIEITSEDPDQSKVVDRVHADPTAPPKEEEFYWGETDGHLVVGRILATQETGGRTGVLVTSYLNTDNAMTEEERAYSSQGVSRETIETTQVNGIWVKSQSTKKQWTADLGIAEESEDYFTDYEFNP